MSFISTHIVFSSPRFSTGSHHIGLHVRPHSGAYDCPLLTHPLFSLSQISGALDEFFTLLLYLNTTLCGGLDNVFFFSEGAMIDRYGILEMSLT